MNADVGVCLLCKARRVEAALRKPRTSSPGTYVTNFLHLFPVTQLRYSRRNFVRPGYPEWFVELIIILPHLIDQPQIKLPLDSPRI